MVSRSIDDPPAIAAIEAIHGGHVEQLQRLLADNPGLATARVDGSRTLLHTAKPRRLSGGTRRRLRDGFRSVAFLPSFQRR
jgi:hypothetical protein